MKIYKYMTARTFQEYIDSHMNGEVYLSRWKEFNDPMEGFFASPGHDGFQNVIDAVVGQKATYGVCCFCRSFKKSILWSYYANKHKGVCLELDVKRSQLPQDCVLERVSYSHILPKLDLTKGVEEQARCFLLTKPKPWQHEREIRLLCRSRVESTIQLGRLTGIIYGVRYTDGDQQGQATQGAVEIAQMGRRGAPVLYRAVIERETLEIGRRQIDQNDSNYSVSS